MSTVDTPKVKKPTAKQVFANVAPIDSTHVTAFFDKAIRVPNTTRLDGVMAKMGDNPFSIVSVEGHGDDLFAVPYAIKSGDAKKGERALASALKTRKISIAKLGK